jgi:hypothetical protein
MYDEGKHIAYQVPSQAIEAKAFEFKRLMNCRALDQ